MSAAADDELPPERSTPQAQPTGRSDADLRELTRQQMLRAIGGWSGTLIATIPTVVFVAVNAVSGLRPALAAAVGVALALTAYRAWRKQPLQQALSGLGGVLIATLIASWMGEARGYFLYGIWVSFIYAGVFVISMVVRRPIVGLAWEFLDASPQPAQPWYRNRVLLRGYDLATGAAALVFLARGLVQLALFDRKATGWLAFARISMGFPLYLAALGFGFWIVNRARRTVSASLGYDEPGSAPSTA